MGELKRDKEEVIKSFKVFIKVMIVNSACNFKKKYYTQKIETVPFDEFTENKVSLSLFDDDIFFVETKSLEDIMRDIGYNKKISKTERKILRFIQMGYTKKEIASKTGVTVGSVNTVLRRLRNKIGGKRND